MKTPFIKHRVLWRLWWATVKAKKRGVIPKSAHFRCAEGGCETKVSDLRFLWVGCICKMHAWVRRVER